MTLFLFGAILCFIGLMSYIHYIDKGDAAVGEKAFFSIISFSLFVFFARRFYRRYKQTPGLAGITGSLACRICAVLVAFGILLTALPLGIGLLDSRFEQNLEGMMGSVVSYLAAGFLSLRSGSRKCRQRCYAFGGFGILLIVLNLAGYNSTARRRVTLYGGLVGQSEANLRSVIQTAEAIAPCVVWLKATMVSSRRPGRRGRSS